MFAKYNVEGIGHKLKLSRTEFFRLSSFSALRKRQWVIPMRDAISSDLRTAGRLFKFGLHAGDTIGERLTTQSLSQFVDQQRKR